MQRRAKHSLFAHYLDHETVLNNFCVVSFMRISAYELVVMNIHRVHRIHIPDGNGLFLAKSHRLVPRAPPASWKYFSKCFDDFRLALKSSIAIGRFNEDGSTDHSAGLRRPF